MHVGWYIIETMAVFNCLREAHCDHRLVVVLLVPQLFRNAKLTLSLKTVKAFPEQMLHQSQQLQKNLNQTKSVHMYKWTLLNSHHVKVKSIAS